eukprot:Sdes_comp10937_c0_seq2m2584
MEPNEFDKELKKYPIIRSRDYQTHSTASIYQDCNPSQPDNLLAHQSTSFRIGAHRSPTVEPRQACDESTNANVQKESSEKVHLRVKIMKAATLGLPSEVKISVFLLKTTVLDLKQLLSKETNLDSKHMKLLFKGKSLHGTPTNFHCFSPFFPPFHSFFLFLLLSIIRRKPVGSFPFCPQRFAHTFSIQSK